MKKKEKEKTKEKEKEVDVGGYDQVVKENMYSVMTWFAQKQLGLKPKRIQPLPTELSHILERRIDGVSLVETFEEGEEDFLLHIEVQRSNEPHIHYRMMEYKGMLLHQYKMPVIQYILYIGDEPMNMPNEYTDAQWTVHYELKDMKSISAFSLIKSPVPQEGIMAILADYEGQAPALIVEEILKKLKMLVKSEKEFQKYLSQLLILAKLRNLAKEVENQANMLDITFTIEDVPFYSKIKSETQIEIAKRMLQANEFSIQQIAAFTSLPEATVQSLSQE